MDRVIQSNKKLKKRIVIAIIFSILSIVIAYFIFFNEEYKDILMVDYSKLEISQVKSESFEEFIPIECIVQPSQTIFLDILQGGFIEEIFVEDGEFVNKSDTILKLSNPELEMRYMDSESRIVDGINNLQSSRLNIEQSIFNRQKEIIELRYKIEEAEKKLNRNQELISDSFVSIEELESIQRDYNNLVDQMEITQGLKRIDSIQRLSQISQINISEKRMLKNLDMLHQNLNNLHVIALRSGRISNFKPAIGKIVITGENIGQLDIYDGYLLKADINERYLSRVYESQKAELIHNNSKYVLQISKIFSEVIDGSFQVDFIFNDTIPEGLVKGQTLRLKLVFSDKQDAIVLKRGNFFEETGGNWVYIVDQQDEFALKRNIVIGRQNANFYEILEGLEVGDNVIISSYSGFGNKEKLKFKNRN